MRTFIFLSASSSPVTSGRFVRLRYSDSWTDYKKKARTIAIKVTIINAEEILRVSTAKMGVARDGYGLFSANGCRVELDDGSKGEL